MGRAGLAAQLWRRACGVSAAVISTLPHSRRNPASPCGPP